MSPEEIEETIQRYNRRFEIFGHDQRSLGWGEKGRGKLRYEILISQWGLAGCSVLDFGCGFGDLLDLLLERKTPDFTYCGIDINPTFVDVAQSRFKENHTGHEFICGNIQSYPFGRKFDYIFSSGVFNHKLKDNVKFISDSMAKFNELSVKGFAANFLSDKVDFRYDYTYHADPGEIIEMAYRYSNRVILNNDYFPYEFTLFVSKDTEVDQQLTIYKNHNLLPRC